MAEAAVCALKSCGISISGVISAPSPVHSETPPNSSPSESKSIGNCIRVIYGGHPIPNAGSESAARAILETVSQSPPSRTLIIALISGGASALLAAPANGISLADKQQTTARCLRSGAPITALNTLRKHLSRFKGGELARAAAPRALIALILSDVIGDPLEVIASGPTVPDPSTFADCMRICQQYSLLDQLPESVRVHLQRGVTGQIADTPKPEEKCFDRVRNILVGSAALSAKAAMNLLQNVGIVTEIFSDALQGEAKQVAQNLLYRDLPQLVSKQQQRKSNRPIAFIATGEFTVTVRGNGKGGRNQEMLLALMLELRKKQKNKKKKNILSKFSHWVIIAAACDGIEGNSPACGAILDSTSLQRSVQCRLDLEAALAANNSFNVFHSLGDAICCGPTGTNVNDILIILLSNQEASIASKY